MVIAALRSGEWLHAQRVKDYLRLIAVINLAVIAALIVTANGGVDFNGHLLGTDFLSFWSASSLVHNGASPYDLAAHIDLQRQIYAPRDGYVAFFYPPPYLLYIWPLAWLGYFPALALWLGTTGAAFALAVRAWLGRLPWWALLAFPPVLIEITHGQSAFLLAALLGGGIGLIVTGRPVLGGVLLGLAVFKPQFGLLLPVVLVAARQWRALLAAGLTALALGAAATLAFGLPVWAQWWAVTGPAQAALSEGSVAFAKMQSLFAALRLAGMAAAPAYAAQGALTVAVMAVLAWLGWRRGLTRQVGAATLVGALLATPFVLDYDLLLLAFPLALLALGPARSWERSVAALAFITPAFARGLASASGVAVMVPVLLALFVLLVRRAAADQGGLNG